ncbi:hypothetical protein [Streptomyces sp. ISBFB 2968]|uniref:hypothetical protein n=1 Tax=Streptomyces sp. ISBFB 2968 TaxID=2903527 RepID=UPI002FDC30E3
MTATTTTWPAHTTEPKPVPLPNLGRCAACGDEIRLRDNGRLYVHGCTDDGQLPLLTLRPTFARWLWMQSKRRDDYKNLATLVAGRHFRGCTRSPKITAADVEWTTAEELHQQLHARQFALTGSEAMRINGERCGGACRDLAKIAAIYGRLIADGDPALVGRDESAPGPTARVHHDAKGWVLPDYSDFADCTTNYQRSLDGRPACTDTAVWKVVENYGMHLTIGFYCDADLPEQHRGTNAA